MRAIQVASSLSSKKNRHRPARGVRATQFGNKKKMGRPHKAGDDIFGLG
jgi:hypothetical protein